MRHFDDVTDPLDEHRAALAKIDATVAQMTMRAGDALACARGCDACCVDGLSVLPVEAALIEAHGALPPRKQREGMCVFLDDDGACTIYDVRPVLCRTHGLALKTAEPEPSSRNLRILGDNISACELNYTARAPRDEEVLDATKVMMLLVTVDRRYRAHVGMDDDTSRVPLRDVADALRPTSTFKRQR